MLAPPSTKLERRRRAFATLSVTGFAPLVRIGGLSLKRARAAANSRRARLRRKLVAAGYDLVELPLPPEVKRAWIARERSTNPNAPLPLESFPSDLVDILVEWAGRWLRAVTK
jgi:hypothetical protein